MTNFEINTIGEYQETIDEIKRKFNVCWFRGLTDSGYKLVPSIYRSPYSPDYEALFLAQFKSEAPPFLSRSPNDDWEWLFLMQHYNVPTRLMDWSANPLVALTFALKKLSSDKDDIKDLAVYCINPLKLNERVSGFNFDEKNPLPFIGQEQYHTYGINSKKRNNLPIAIVGPFNSDRIVAQKGFFTLFPFELEKEIETNEFSDDFLMKITLKKGKLFEMKESLENLGFTYESLFPGLDSIGKSIVNSFNKRSHV